MEMGEQLTLVFILLVVFQFKHFLCDFPLQFSFMIKRKCSPNWDFFFPLLAHALMHGIFTLITCLLIRPDLWYLAPLDVVTHFTLDRLKSGPRYLGRFNDHQKASFWSILGFDQALHHVTHMFFVYLIVV